MIKKIFITGFAVFFVISVIVTLISLIFPSQVNVSKSILVNKAHKDVRSNLLDLSKWPYWNPVLQDTTVNYLWDENQTVRWTTSDGKKHAIHLDEKTADSLSVSFFSENKLVFLSGFNIIAHESQPQLTKVEWWINEQLGWYPWNKFYGLFSESLRETYMENTLKYFKVHIED